MCAVELSIQPEIAPVAADWPLEAAVEYSNMVLAAACDELGTREPEVLLMFPADEERYAAAAVDWSTAQTVDTTTERIGGSVVAKVFTRGAREATEFLVLFNPRMLLLNQDSTCLMLPSMVAHEVGHVVTHLLREAAGFESTTPIGPISATRATAELLADEHDATVFMRDAPVCSVTVGDDTFSYRALLIESYSDELLRLLVDEVSPGWADTVQAYRVGGLGLDEMFRRLIESISGVLTVVIHYETNRQLEGLPLSAALADRPDWQLYVEPFLVTVATATTGNHGDRKMAGASGVGAFERGLLQLLGTLGLTLSVRGAGDYIDVCEPTWA